MRDNKELHRKGNSKCQSVKANWFHRVCQKKLEKRNILKLEMIKLESQEAKMVFSG